MMIVKTSNTCHPEDKAIGIKLPVHMPGVAPMQKAEAPPRSSSRSSQCLHPCHHQAPWPFPRQPQPFVHPPSHSSRLTLLQHAPHVPHVSSPSRLPISCLTPRLSWQPARLASCSPPNLFLRPRARLVPPLPPMPLVSLIL